METSGISVRYILLAMTTALSIVWQTACNRAEQASIPKPTERSAVVESHGLHEKRTDRLSEIMRRLKSMNLDAIAVDLQEKGHQRRNLNDVSELAVELALDAQVIPMIFENPEISPEARRAMKRLSVQLHQQASEMRRAAQDNNPALVKSRLDAMLITCNECHTTFRAPLVAFGTPDARGPSNQSQLTYSAPSSRR